jgi:hypothetical protein
MDEPPSYVNDQNYSWEKITWHVPKWQFLRIQALWNPTRHMIMIKHNQNGNWNIWIMVNFDINDLQVINRCNDVEYNDQSHHPIIASLVTSIAPYNVDEC